MARRERVPSQEPSRGLLYPVPFGPRTSGAQSGRLRSRLRKLSRGPPPFAVHRRAGLRRLPHARGTISKSGLPESSHCGLCSRGPGRAGQCETPIVNWRSKAAASAARPNRRSKPARLRTSCRVWLFCGPRVFRSISSTRPSGNRFLGLRHGGQRVEDQRYHRAVLAVHSFGRGYRAP